MLVVLVVLVVLVDVGPPPVAKVHIILDGSPYSSMVLPCSPYLSLLVLAGISSEPVV